MSRLRFVALMIAPLCFTAACEQPVSYVEGPEAASLAGRVRGQLVVKQGRDSTENDPGILVLSLPQGERRTIRKYPGSELEGWIENVSGPARNGRIAFVEEERIQSRRYTIKTIALDGSAEREEFRHEGGGFEESFALSPSGGHIAFVGTLADLQMPGALLQTGPLMIWDVAKKAATTTGVTAAGEPLAWLPDSRRLVYVEMVPAAALAAEIEAGRKTDPKFLGGVEGWSRLPVVYVLDVVSGKKNYVHLGWHPLVAHDGGSVIVKWGSYRRVDLATGAWSRLKWPGQWLPPIALLPGDLLIYPGLPTRGMKVRHRKYGSFSVGTPLGTIKVADLNTGQFQTLIEFADGRERFTFGATNP
jgi:hypothetical protein